MAGFEIAEAFVRVRPEVDEGEFAGAATEAGQKTGDLITKGIGAAVLLNGAKTVAPAMKDFVSSNFDLSKEMQALANKSAVVFGDELGMVKDWAADSAHAMGLTKSEATGLAAGMGDLLVPMGFTREQAAKMSTETLGLAGALSEWSGGQYSAAETSDILTKAMLGERDGLKALGISISQDEVNTEAARVAKENFGKSLEDLTAEEAKQADAIATTNLIMAKSTDAQDAYASGAAGLARSQAELSAKMAEGKEMMAGALIPAFGLLTGALDVLPGSMGNVVLGLAGMGMEVAPLVGSLGQMMVGFKMAGLSMASITGPIVSVVTGFASIVTGAVTSAASVVASVATQVAQWVLLGVQSLLHAAKVAAAWLIAMGPIALVIAAVVGLVVAIVKNWETITAVISAGWEFVKSITLVVWEAIKAFFSATLAFLTNLFTTVWDAIKAFLSATWETIKKVATTIFDAIKAYFEFVLDFYKKVFTTIWDAIKAMLDKTWNAIKQVAETVFNAIKAFFERVLDGWKNIFTTTWETIKSVLTTIFNAIKAVAESIFNAIKAFFERVLQGWKNIFEATWNAIKGTVTGIWNGIKATAESIWNALSGFFTGVVDRIKNTITSAFETVRNVLSGIWNGIKATASSIWNAITGAVGGAVDGMKNRIVGAWESIRDRLGGVINTIKDAINSLIRGWNNLSFTFPRHSFDWNGPLPGGNITVGGWTIGTPNIPMLAEGGTALRAGLALVGEEGPELLHLPRGATVEPLDHAAARSGGGDTYNVTVKMSAKDLKEMRDVTDFFKKVRSVTRQGVGDGMSEVA